MPVLPTSLLKTVIEKLPEEWKMKGSSIPNFLEKQGVKPEELDNSGIRDIGNTSEHVTKSDLQTMESQRKDQFSTELYQAGPNANWSHITAPESNMQSYSVNLRKYKVKGGDRKVTSHMGSRNDYLWHSRTTREPDVGGYTTRVVHEIQSDLHQQGRRFGYTYGEAQAKIDAAITKRSELQKQEADLRAKKRALNEAQDKLLANGAPTAGEALIPVRENVNKINEINRQLSSLKDTMSKFESDLSTLTARAKAEKETILALDKAKKEKLDLYDNNIYELKNTLKNIEYGKSIGKDYSPGIEEYYTDKLAKEEAGRASLLNKEINSERTSPFPPSPFEKNWHRKALEQEVLDAARDGDSAIAVPLEGARGPLMRGEGVQKWYETTIRGTLKKLAKDIGGTYRETNSLIEKPKDIEDAGRILDNSPKGQDIFDRIQTVLTLNNKDVNPTNVKEEFFKNYDFYAQPIVKAPDNMQLFDAMWYEHDPDVRNSLPNIGADYITDVVNYMRELPADTLDHSGVDKELLDDPNFPGSDTDYEKIAQFMHDHWNAVSPLLPEEVTNSTAPNMGQIVLPKDKSKLSKLKLYSAGGGASLAMNDEQNKKLRNTIHSLPDNFEMDSKIVPTYLKEHGISEDAIRSAGITDVTDSKLTKGDLQVLSAYPKGGDSTKAVPQSGGKVSSVQINNDTVGKALSAGVPISEIKSYLSEKGGDQNLVNSTVDSVINAKIDDARKQNIPEEEIKNYMKSSLGATEEDLAHYFPDTTKPVAGAPAAQPTDMPISEDYKHKEAPGASLDKVDTTQVPDKYTPEELTNMYRAIGRKYATFGKQLAGLGSEKYKQEAFQDEFNLASMVVKGLQSHGVTARLEPDISGPIPTYNIYMTDKTTGEEHLMDTSFWQDLKNSKFEITMGVTTAAAAGASLEELGVAIPPVGPWAWLAKGGLMLVGGALGASVGRVNDIAYMANAMGELDKIQSKFYMDQMKDAGIADATFGILGTTAFKATTGMIKLVGGAWNLAIAGNMKGAYKALQDQLGIDESQIKEIISQWEQVTGTKAPGVTTRAKAMHVIPQTVPGAEDIVGQAAQLSPKVSAHLQQVISGRAQDVISGVDNLTNDNIGIVLHDELGKYTNTVKSYYTGIKQHAIDSMKDTGFKFDYDQLALEPVFDAIEKNINNPQTKEFFLNKLSHIRELGQIVDADGKRVIGFDTKNRDFSNLLELRKVINDFKFNKKISGHGNYEMIKNLLSGIDKEIAGAAKDHMPDADIWLKEWKKANTEYSKMLMLRDNVMYKALTKKGVNIDNVVASLTKDIKSFDGTFMQVLAKVPDRVKRAAEGAVFKKLLENHTIGFEGGFQAIHFPNLQKDLEKVTFTTADNREMKRAVNELANVFKNDVNISRAMGKIHLEKFKSYLTTDPVVRLKFEVANQMFNWFKRMLPSERGNATALVFKTAKLLKNPANAKTVNEIMRGLPDDPQLQTTIKRLAIEYAKFGQKENYPYVRAFRTGIPGRSHKALDGKYGKGYYYTTDKTKAEARSAITGGKVFKDKLLPSRIATEQDINDMLGIDNFKMEMLKNNPSIVEMLKASLYQGVSSGDEVMVFK